MFPTPTSALTPNTYAYESSPLVKPTGFREYDARWLLEKEINLMGVQALGMGLGTLIRQMGVRPEIVIGHDFRSYSASIKYALITGLLAAGCKVHDIGLAVTPMAYFAQFDLPGGGSYRFVENFPARYIADLTNRRKLTRRLKVVAACGNGTAGAFS